MRSFLVRKINNFTKTLSLRAKVPNTYGARLYIVQCTAYTIHYYLFKRLVISAQGNMIHLNVHYMV